MTDRDTNCRSASPPARAAVDGFRAAFGRDPHVIVRSPGRVNLIGDHTDYSGGWVLPIAIDRAVWVAAARSTAHQVTAFSAQFNELREFPTVRPPESPITGWMKYVHAVCEASQEAGISAGGADLWIGGDLPAGAGLASSAALEVGVALVLQTLAGRSLPPEVTARLCRRAENEFVGAPCGLMDQLCCVAACSERGLLLDCRAERYEHVPLPWEAGATSAATLLVIDSGVRHSIAGSGYGDRRSECEEVLRLAQQVRPGVTSLRDLDDADLAWLEDELPSMLLRRVRHVITENARVLAVVSALRAGDLSSIGKHMNASHDSLRDDYDVSCPEMELIIRAAWNAPGVLGARMTGGGFGGCAIALVDASCVAGLVDRFGQISTGGHAAGGTRHAEVADDKGIGHAAGAARPLGELDRAHGLKISSFPAHSADGARSIVPFVE